MPRRLRAALGSPASSRERRCMSCPVTVRQSIGVVEVAEEVVVGNQQEGG